MSPAAAVLVCALDLLGRSQTIAPVQFHASPPPGASSNAEAFVTRSPDTIHLITSTAVFRDALLPEASGLRLEACRKIASIIVHEEWHLKNGADERGAYEAQLMALELMHAPSTTTRSVRQAMKTVLARNRGSSAPPVSTMARADR